MRYMHSSGLHLIRKVCTKNRVSHMHNENIANALNTLLFINAHYFQPMRKQNCLYFGDKQTEIKLLKHAIVYEHVLGLVAEITVTKV